MKSKFSANKYFKKVKNESNIKDAINKTKEEIQYQYKNTDLNTLVKRYTLLHNKKTHLLPAIKSGLLLVGSVVFTSIITMMLTTNYTDEKIDIENLEMIQRLIYLIPFLLFSILLIAILISFGKYLIKTLLHFDSEFDLFIAPFEMNTIEDILEINEIELPK